MRHHHTCISHMLEFRSIPSVLLFEKLWPEENQEFEARNVRCPVNLLLFFFPFFPIFLFFFFPL
jgi:hypothetical protein